jgi:hypothetical protein
MDDNGCARSGFGRFSEGGVVPRLRARRNEFAAAMLVLRVNVVPAKRRAEGIWLLARSADCARPNALRPVMINSSSGSSHAP